MIRILLADDNPAVRSYLRGLLEQQEGWCVCDEASDGVDAVRRFEKGHHDLIVLDFQMPEMNGLEAAKRIIRESPETPILMVTLYPSTQLSAEARKVGIKGTCPKTHISSVVDAVAALLRQETYFPSVISP